MEPVTRRGFLAGALSLAALPLLPSLGEAAPAKKGTRFVFMTDFHIEPELGAPEGVAMAVKKVLSLKPRPEFILVGGDTVMDLLNVTRERADLQFQLFKEALKPVEMPVYYTVGNHDCFGWASSNENLRSDAEYGKKLYQDKVAGDRTYRSWDTGGWHFVILDSIQPTKGGWFARIDDDQLRWLKNDLEALPAGTPVIVSVHVPLFTIFEQYTEGAMTPPNSSTVVENAKDVFTILSQHNVKAVFQGHTHVLEECTYRGTKYVTGGAVCGEWWRGPRLGVHPEGFCVVDCGATDLKWEYVPYGWKART